MNLTINGKTYDLREWVVDLLITAVAFAIGARVFMTSETPVVDQPINFLITLGITAAVFKVARQWKAFG